MGENLIEISNLKSWYKKDLNIIDDASFSIDENEIVALVGSNGSGKTT